MPYLVVIGFVILLGILVVARSAQSEARSAPQRPPATATRPETPSSGTGSLGGNTSRTLSDLYLWDSRRIAHRHETRAATLDFFGVVASGLAGLVALGTVVAVLAADDQLEHSTKVMLAISASGGVLALIAVAAVFFGFGAVVRNTSRGLAIAAGVALDSYEPPDDEDVPTEPQQAMADAPASARLVPAREPGADARWQPPDS